VKGTVTAAPGVYPVTFTAKNSEGSASVTLSVRVNEKPVFKTQSLPDGSTLSEYKTTEGKDVQVVAEGLDVTFASKDLPTGLSLDAKTGVISGTPSKGGELKFTVTATNELGSTDQQYAIEVSEPAAVSTQSLAPVVAGQAYEQKIETTGYPAAKVTVEGLPEGLSFQDGTISGTVAADKVGSYQVTAEADNQVGGKPASKTFTLYVATQPTINTASLQDAVAGSKYSIDL
ncbi:Ig domain-containing protein, partial [Pseudoscardovia radai]|uniref:Ig domain-containing protein n=1 Tax=Pseudoscardovia radai TaxID=987066 RepID=UPI003994C944